ncbi:hypothetical protein NIES2101_26755 [Calothrix sp. HK-06]|nr:hypothetical protein NIES2101_26755 [Calothrix sp. HK-06]
MDTVLKDTTANSFIEAMELAYNFSSVEHPAERLSIRLGDNLIYGKDGSGAIINNLSPNLVALLSAVVVDEKPPLELALEDEVLNQPVSIQIDGFTVLSYCDGVYKEKLFLEQVYEDEKLKEAFIAVKDKASLSVSSLSINALVDGEVVNPSDVLIYEERAGVTVSPVISEVEEVAPQEIVVNNTYLVASTLEQTCWEIEVTPETLRILEEDLKQSRNVFVVPDTQSGVQAGATLEVEVQPLSKIQQQLPTQKAILDDALQLDSNNIVDTDEFKHDEQPVVSEVSEHEVASQLETSVVSVSLADNISINSGASRMFVATAENNLITAIAETGDADNNDAVDAASINLLQAKDVNLQVDASLRDQQAHKLMTTIVAIGMASGKNEIKTKGGEYVVQLGSDGSALLRSAAGVIYDGLPNIKQASINLMSDLDINCLSKSVENTAAYMREAEKEKEKQLEI